MGWFDGVSNGIIATGGATMTDVLPPTTNSTSLLQVDSAFAGVNYLELLKTTNLDNLISALNNDPETEGSGNTADTQSIFNKFSIFKYSKFINGAVYQADAHFIGYVGRQQGDPQNTTSDNINDSFTKQVTMSNEFDQLMLNTGSGDESASILKQRIGDNTQRLAAHQRSANNYAVKNASSLANPTASNIIKWAQTQSMQSVTGFQPYAMTDFMFCKNYGKIPNNRLITLRRYPFPIDDAIREEGKKNPFPIAQAVTWFGEGTKNKLSEIGVMNWGLRWKSIAVEQQDVTGNEVTVTDLLGVFKSNVDLKPLADALEAIYVGVNGTDAQLQQLSGIEGKMQQYAKDLYLDKGPYWNRVFGPVNVIHESTRRDRGMQPGWDQPFTLNFHYEFRSFNGLSPKIVALDLIAHFLNLTYNDAQFLGILGRYFPRLGVKFNPTITATLGKLLTEWGTNFTGDLSTMADKLEPIYAAMKAGASQMIKGFTGTSDPSSLQRDVLDSEGNVVGKAIDKSLTNVVQATTASLLANAIPEFISVRSALSDRPIGEWHLVVGNPMNPIMTMGDLVVQNCIMEFDEEMGPDDFPTGCTFKVKLKQGKPRDKAAIERIFNLGDSKLMYNTLRNPSSAEDTFGETNNKQWKELVTNGGDNSLSDTEKDELKKKMSTGTFNKYRNRIRKSYGYNAVDGEAGQPDKTANDILDDSLLWLYYDRGQEKT